MTAVQWQLFTSYVVITMTILQIHAAILSRKEAVRQCYKKFDAPGRYVFEEGTVRQFKYGNCSAKFDAPSGSRIRFTFEEVDISCESYAVKFLDGWIISSGYLHRPRPILPKELISDPTRTRQLCRSPSSNSIVITSSQNFAEILYKLGPGESFTVNVETVPANDQLLTTAACNNMVDGHKPGQYVLRVSSVEPVVQSCRIYVNGGVSIRALQTTVLQTYRLNCGNQGARLSVSNDWSTENRNARLSCEAANCSRKNPLRQGCPQSVITLEMTGPDTICDDEEIASGTEMVLDIQPLSDLEAEMYGDCFS